MERTVAWLLEHRCLQVRYEQLAAVLDKLLAVEASPACWKPGVLVEDWRIEDNTVRLYSALGDLTEATPLRPGPPRHPRTLMTGGPTTGDGQHHRGEGLRMSAATGHDHS